MKNQISTLLIILVSSLIYSQTEYVEKYDNGQIKIQGFLIDSVLTGKFTEYYKSGQIKTTGEYKNCEYETNHTRIYLGGCGVGNNSSFRKGKKDGEWKHYFENGILKSKTSYFCGLKQGNFFYYHENGTVFFIDFYTADTLMGTQMFYENGQLKLVSTYSYEYSKYDEHDLKRTVETEYYKDGSCKIQRVIQELKNNVEKENYKEYYPNGFLKTDSQIINHDKNGIYREYYENGNTKYEGFFKDDQPIDKEYFYNSNGEVIKVLTWKDGKIIETEIRNARG
ncbi:hypothetical protein JCM19294_791 [Nonlabens tegetincola]|uniref:Uncharacterized protein n=1 Tax=Nonlabens tegetincola TaxID=323273 RepID=A0A090Q8R2_9FLAO|nr:hypothetical protein [Nonlabens tegetincola]GAK98158.1 hypothetical protein JCM19294_791 [Nonlabens tegetincola]